MVGARKPIGSKSLRRLLNGALFNRAVRSPPPRSTPFLSFAPIFSRPPWTHGAQFTLSYQVLSQSLFRSLVLNLLILRFNAYVYDKLCDGLQLKWTLDLKFVKFVTLMIMGSRKNDISLHCQSECALFSILISSWTCKWCLSYSVKNVSVLNLGDDSQLSVQFVACSSCSSFFISPFVSLFVHSFCWVWC